MGFLKKIADIFSGGASGRDSNNGFFVYVKLNRSGEILRLRLIKGYDISQDEKGNYFCRKNLIGTRHFERATADFTFDRNYNLTGAAIEGGELSDAASFEKQEQERATD